MPHAQLSLPPSSDPTRSSWFWPAAIGVGLVALAFVLGENHGVNEVQEALEEGGYYEDDEEDDDVQEEADEEDGDDAGDEDPAAPVGRYAKARRRR